MHSLELDGKGERKEKAASIKCSVLDDGIPCKLFSGMSIKQEMQNPVIIFTQLCAVAFA